MIRAMRMRLVGSVAGTVLIAGLAAAQTYPTKPIRFIIPYPPGGASDVTARILGAKLTEAWGQQVVIDNRPGANGIVALDLAAKATPDGHTILMANLGPNAINAGVYSKLPYDSLKSFAPITLTTIVPQVIVANPALGANNLQQMIAIAKAKPGQLKYGNGGNGSANHLAMEMLKMMTGIDIGAIAYKGDAPALTDVMSGQIQFALPTVLAAGPLIKAGRLRAVAVTPKKRVAALPDVATVAESGVPQFESVSWGGVMAPAGTPGAIVGRLHAEFVRILAMPDVRDRLSGLGAEIVGSTPAEFEAYLKAEIAKWGKVAKQAGVRLD
jgi:tripartite-type tricarboxylate transporter receptor subunit TctC